MATYSEFKAQVRRMLEEPTPGVWSDESLLWWCNEGIRELSIVAKPQRDEAYTDTVASQTTYTLPANTLEVLAVFYDNKRLRREQLESDWYDLDYLEETGTPVSYALTDDTIYLKPTPDDAKELRFFRMSIPDALTADTDSMPWSSHYDTALMFYVLMRAFEQIENFDSANQYLARWNEAKIQSAAQAGIERQKLRAASPVEVY